MQGAFMLDLRYAFLRMAYICLLTPSMAAEMPAKLVSAKSSSLADRSVELLFAKDWDATLRSDPQRASTLGEHRFDERLTDYSIQAIERRKANDRDALRDALAINRKRLSEQNKVSYDLFVWTKRIAVEGQRFPTELVPITHLDGMVINLSQLPDAMAFKSKDDYARYLSRLEGIPSQVDQVIKLLARGLAIGFTPPRGAVAGIPAVISDLFPQEPAKSPLLAPYLEMPESIPATEREALASEARISFRKKVVPALMRLLDYFRDTYLPGCRATIGCSGLPDGEAYYRWAVKAQTTTRLTPPQIHEMGKSEVARIRREMNKLINEVGFKGDFKAFLEHLRIDPKFFYTSPEDLLQAYQAMAKPANEQLPRLFNRLPNLGYGVKRIPVSREPFEIAVYYDQTPTQDGSNGNLFVNGYALGTRPKYDMEALFLHETVPGHHLQLKIAEEMSFLPEFRKNLILNAYCEGWALYAETLGRDMGFYRDPYSRFGMLNNELLRAVRVVVDSGVHALGWSEDEATAYLLANTTQAEATARKEVNRYAIWPAQAVTYTVGKNEILRLRRKAESSLGSRFDLAKFHDQVLSEGALTLDQLDRIVNAWIDKTKWGTTSNIPLKSGS